MYLNFPSTAEPEEIQAQLDRLPASTDNRILAARFEDGSYRVVGRIVKEPDCPQEDFDHVIEWLAKTY